MLPEGETSEDLGSRCEATDARQPGGDFYFLAGAVARLVTYLFDEEKVWVSAKRN
jgi:hypothetical protein